MAKYKNNLKGLFMTTRNWFIVGGATAAAALIVFLAFKNCKVKSDAENEINALQNTIAQKDSTIRVVRDSLYNCMNPKPKPKKPKQPAKPKQPVVNQTTNQTVINTGTININTSETRKEVVEVIEVPVVQQTTNQTLINTGTINVGGKVSAPPAPVSVKIESKTTFFYERTGR